MKDHLKASHSFSWRVVQVICAGSLDTFQVYVWSVRTGRLLDVLAGHEGPVAGLAFSPTQSLLASASWDKTVRTWDVFRSLPSLSHSSALSFAIHRWKTRNVDAAGRCSRSLCTQKHPAAICRCPTARKCTEWRSTCLLLTATADRCCTSVTCLGLCFSACEVQYCGLSAHH